MDFFTDIQNAFPDSKLSSPSILLLALVSILVAAFFLKLKSSIFQGKKLPPGSMGLPLIGETISFVRAQKQDTTNQWIKERVDKFGPVFKTSLLGKKIAVLTDQSGLRLAFNGKEEGVSYKQPMAMAALLGKNSLFEMAGPRHKLIRGCFVDFMKPESLQLFVGEIDLLVQKQLQELEGKDSIQIVTLMKKIAFNVTCSIIFGFQDDHEKNLLLKDFTIVLQGFWTIPINFPGTVFHRALKARARLCKRLSRTINMRKSDFIEGRFEPKNNIITSLLKLRENGKELEEEVILDMVIALILASHDTITVLLTMFIRHLARDSMVYNEVIKEQEEVMKDKGGKDERLTWRHINAMKYTWSVAQELMRFYPPIFGNYRLVTRDISFQGFNIPKGWQLLWVTSMTHMDNNIFEEPDKFDPSRFNNSSKTCPLYTYIPFGAGPRICTGVEFTKVEALVVMHYFITKYLWKEMLPNEPITRQPIPYPANGLPVKLFPL